MARALCTCALSSRPPSPSPSATGAAERASSRCTELSTGEPSSFDCSGAWNAAAALSDEGPAAQLKAALPLLATVLVFAAAAAIAARAGKRAGTSLV